jgi:hypothetical protein
MRTSTGISRVLAHRAHGALLDHPQQLHLHQQRQVGDLVEQQRAALGAADQALLVGGRAVKLPLRWPNSSLSISSEGSRRS